MFNITMNPLILITIVPVLSGILGFLIYRLRNEFYFLGTLITLYQSFNLFIITRRPIALNYNLFSLRQINFGFYLDQFSGIIILAISLISFLILLYSLRSMRGYKHLKSYYLLLLTTMSIVNGLILSNNLIMIFSFSILLLIVLYLFIIITVENPSFIANPALLIVGISNVLILLGISILLYQYNTVLIISELKLSVSDPILTTSFILLLIGIIGKIGLVPLHAWTLKLTKSPVTIMTLIPMIIDKIVGIYLLFRISYFIFNINEYFLIRVIILGVGGLGIVIGGIMALKAKEAYRLLTFSSITQIGLIFIGIGCGNPFGLTGSIYHLINYLSFQPSLLLTIGSVEYWTKTTQLDNFVGLGAKMPITFFVLLIAVLASSGFFPLNGFFSKWLIFEGLLKMNTVIINPISLIFIIITVFGCIITPVYFLKLLYAFRGEHPKYSEKIRDPGFTMWASPALLSLICLVLGVFTSRLSWRSITLPSIIDVFPNASNINPWTFGPALIILCASLLIGIIIYYIKLYPARLRSA